MSAPPVRQSGSSALKIVLVSFAVLLVLGIAGVAGAVFFIAKKAESKVAELREKGVDVRDAIAKAGKAMETKAGCDLLAKDDAGEILGLKIVRNEGNAAGDQAEFCKYWTDEASMTGATEKANEERKEAAAAQHDANEPDSKQIDDLVKGISVNVGNDNNHDDPALLSVAVFRGSGKVATTALKGANLLLGTKSAKVDGPWDEAIFGPLNSVLVLRKGDNSVLIDLRHVPHSRQKGMALAEAIEKSL